MTATRSGPSMLLQARASVARRLIRMGVVDPYVALSYVVWPTEAIRRAEGRVSLGALTHRAYGRRGNA